MRKLILVLLLALSLPAWSQTDWARVAAASDQLVAATPVLPADRLIERIRRIGGDARLSRAENGEALHRYLLQLRQLPESSAARDAVQFIAAMPPPLLVPHPENPSRNYDPIGLAATAAGTLNAWEFRHWEQRANQDLVAGRLDFIAELKSGSSLPAVRGAAAAIGRSFDPGLAERLLREVGDDPALAPLLSAAFEASADPRLVGKLVDLGHTALAVRSVNRLPDAIGQDEARPLLVSLLDHPRLAPVALAALGRQQNLATFDLLAGLLDDARLGVAAAHALGRFDQDWARSRLQDLAGDPRQAVSRRAKALFATRTLQP